MDLWWLSFATEHEFKGAIIAPGERFIDAYLWATFNELNPGGQVKGTRIGAVDDLDCLSRYVGRLLDRPQCDDVDAILAREFSWGEA